MLGRFLVSKAEDLKTKNKISHEESCFGALACKAVLKLKAPLVGFNLPSLNPSPRIAHVLQNYRVWHDNVFPFISSFCSFFFFFFSHSVNSQNSSKA